ncbi:MAG: beta-ketoacyl-ACP synthase II [Bacteroidales bacterium]|jgi:3-oxoacyl-[acyl-carrier-protein] synthase II|nr:beta-ketoacyl-ACP synthase II [Bacteroidales bacterium]
MQLKRVVVTGIGALTPIGNNISEYWNSLANGVSGSDLITRFDASKFKTRFACEVKNFDPAAIFDRKEIKKYDLYTQFALVAATEAITNSGMDLEKTDLERVGVIWASGIGGISTFAEELREFYKGDGTPRFNPFFIPKMISDIAAGQISIKFGLKGPNYATVSACASSSNAIIDAFTYIRLGKADAFVAGGSEAAINESGVGGFNSMQALSTNNDHFQTASRPFDKDRDGFVIGEGAGGLILEEYEHAVKRGAHIYAEVTGGGMSADAYHLTASHPEGDGAFRAMRAALEDAEIVPEQIDYINVHGTSTPVGDPSETKAILRLFGDHAYKLNISSTKSMTGHLLGAAGAIEAIASVLAMENDLVPPTINHFTDDPAIDGKLNLTFNKAQKRIIRYAISNTFGFGGHNTSVVLKNVRQ